MKYRAVYSIALLAGLLCMVQGARAQSFSPPWDDPMSGWMAVYDDRAGYEAGPLSAYFGGGDLTGPYALDELVTLTSDYYTFDFLPETNKYYNGGSGGASFWQNGTGDGGKYLECLTYWGKAVTGIELDVLMEFTINSNTFDTNRYDFAAFIRVVNVADGTALTETNLNLNSIASGSYTLSLTNAASYVGAPLQAGFRVIGTNANPANAASYGGANITVDNLAIWVCDFNPPSPDPMTWETEPYTISDDKIGMTATTATDLSGVEYQFTGYATFPGPPAFVSEWQDSPHYVASGLLPSTTYTIRARAQDLAVNCGPNATGFTPLKTATTLATDTTAPTPDPADIVSAVASPVSVWLTATPATDASAVEYNFVPTGTNGTASGWQSSNEYIDYGLTPETTYEYTVQVRDLSAVTNMTAVSSPISTSTQPVPFAVSLTNDLKGFTFGDSTQAATVHELAMAGFELASLDASKPVYADGTGLTFGNYLGTNGTYTDRNILRTIASDYYAANFQITVTFISSNMPEQVCFVGAGQGLQGQYNIPDYYLEGVSGMTAEASAAETKLSTWFEGSAQTILQDLGLTTFTNRVRLTYDAYNANLTYEIDYDADGADGFAADLTLGPVTPTNIWPQKLYIAGGAGTRMYDLEIRSWYEDDFGLDLSIVSVSGDTATLQWLSSSGQIYDVVYKTNLGAATWTVDAANENIPGTGAVLTPTSTVVGDEVFYQVIEK